MEHKCFYKYEKCEGSFFITICQECGSVKATPIAKIDDPAKKALEEGIRQWEQEQSQRRYVPIDTGMGKLYD